MSGSIGRPLLPQARNRGYDPQLEYSQRHPWYLKRSRTQEHVFRENVHAVNTLLPESVRQ
jgi:hypothetical protein